MENPFYKGFVRKRGNGLGALAQTVGRQAFPVLHVYVDAAAKCTNTDSLELPELDFAEVVSGEKID